MDKARLILEQPCEVCGEPPDEHDGPTTDGCQGSGGSRIVLDPDRLWVVRRGEMIELDPETDVIVRRHGLTICPGAASGWCMIEKAESLDALLSEVDD